MEITKKRGSGWHGDSQGHAVAGQLGGRSTVQRLGIEHFKKIGSVGGKNGPQNFSKNLIFAKQMGQRGGRAGKELCVRCQKNFTRNVICFKCLRVLKKQSND